MGWKANCILINEREPGYLGNALAHDTQRAEELIQRLKIGKYKTVEKTTFDEGMYPNETQLFIGAYDGAAIIGSFVLTNACFDEPPSPFVTRLLAEFPRATILTVLLHSVVNLYGYVYFENGVRQRLRAGNAEDGVVIDEGNPLPEEERLFAQSEMRDGERIYLVDINGEPEEFTDDQMGEDFVFEISKRFFGSRWDEHIHGLPDIFELQMERFEPVKLGFMRNIAERFAR